ncbi:uncharacterized protein TNCV_1170821 [Trichonephila clavipes]|nr:uncharacterized protein TNCV_1170821 [Trichonephila clavipes]
MSRYPDHVVSLMWDPQCLSPQASLVLSYRPTAVGIKGRVDLAQARNRTRTCGVEARYATTRALEDFGKRNMPRKRARRHFSQLREFERGLIIGMKTAGWSTRLVAGQVGCLECVVRNCWEQWTQEGTHTRKTGSGATRKSTRREDRRFVR